MQSPAPDFRARSFINCCAVRIRLARAYLLYCGQSWFDSRQTVLCHLRTVIRISCSFVRSCDFLLLRFSFFQTAFDVVRGAVS